MAVARAPGGLLALSLLAALAAGQVPFAGRCPRPPVVQYFQPQRYLGRWYEHTNYFTVFEVGATCVTAVYTDAGRGKIGVENRQVKNGRRSSIRGVARPVDKSGAARLRVDFESVPSFGSGANYIVVETDYHSYSVVWSCNDFKLFNTQILWILTRERFPNPYLIKSIKRRLRRYGLDPSKLRQTDQKNCPYGH